ncbi:uncharacterized protein [Clytia hemisphaerica]|uniref:uncharacterized protein n=1 Tax=Clytia hemisphaerica TaxID=252671 RepID=UPI0034D70ED5
MHCTIYLKKKNEEVKVRLCQYIFDTPAMAKVMHICGQGALRACMWCKNEGKRISDLNKVVYHGSRKFLPEDHVLRESKGYPGGKPENSEPGVAYSKEEQISLRQQWEDKPNKSQRSKFAKENGVKGNYSFMKLPYHDFSRDVQPDGMHTIRRAVMNVIQYISRQVQASSIDQVTAAEKELRGKKLKKDHTRVLSSEETTLGNSRVDLVNFPPEYTGYKGSVYTNANKVLKNHHGWQEYTVNNVWIFTLRNSLSQRQRRTLFYFFASLSNLFMKKFNEEMLKSVEVHLHQSVALMERDFPAVILNFTTHVLNHFANSMRRFGPLYSSWMYAFERFNSWITRRCNNKAHMESSVMDTYQLFDWVVFCELTKKFPGLEDPENSICKKTLLFNGEGEPLRRLKRKRRVPINLSEEKKALVETKIEKGIKEVMSINKLEKLNEFGENYVLTIGSYCPMQGMKFARVEDILEILTTTGENTYMVELVEFETQFDQETGIKSIEVPNIGSQSTLDYPDQVGEPAVHAIDDNKLWLLSEKANLDFPWLEHHMKH